MVPEHILKAWQKLKDKNWNIYLMKMIIFAKKNDVKCYRQVINKWIDRALLRSAINLIG